jgi:3-hydroxybutyryl-CoA dehydratase
MTTGGAGNGMDGSGRAFDEVRIGESFRRSITITDTHLVLGAGLIGDFNPHHVDDEYAKGSRFGTRILHGMITSALMGAPVGAGDTLTTTWTIVELQDKPKHAGGVVVLHAICRNQAGAVVAEADGKILVQARG